MRFFRWYAELTKRVFQRNHAQGWREVFHKGLIDYWYSLKWSFVTVLCLAVVAVIIHFLWGSLPEPSRNFVVGVVAYVWMHIKPFFAWLWSLNWHGGAVRLQRILLHVAVAMFVFGFVQIIIVSIFLDFLKLVLTGASFKKKKLAIAFLVPFLVLVSFVLASFVGYYFTTSSYGVAIVNWITALTSIQKPVF